MSTGAKPVRELEEATKHSVLPTQIDQGNESSALHAVSPRRPWDNAHSVPKPRYTRSMTLRLEKTAKQSQGSGNQEPTRKLTGRRYNTLLLNADMSVESLEERERRSMIERMPLQERIRELSKTVRAPGKLDSEYLARLPSVTRPQPIAATPPPPLPPHTHLSQPLSSHPSGFPSDGQNNHSQEHSIRRMTSLSRSRSRGRSECEKDAGSTEVGAASKQDDASLLEDVSYFPEFSSEQQDAESARLSLGDESGSRPVRDDSEAGRDMAAREGAGGGLSMRSTLSSRSSKSVTLRNLSRQLSYSGAVTTSSSSLSSSSAVDHVRAPWISGSKLGATSSVPQRTVLPLSEFKVAKERILIQSQLEEIEVLLAKLQKRKSSLQERLCVLEETHPQQEERELSPNSSTRSQRRRASDHPFVMRQTSLSPPTQRRPASAARVRGDAEEQESSGDTGISAIIASMILPSRGRESDEQAKAKKSEATSDVEREREGEKEKEKEDEKDSEIEIVRSPAECLAVSSMPDFLPQTTPEGESEPAEAEIDSAPTVEKPLAAEEGSTEGTELEGAAESAVIQDAKSEQAECTEKPDSPEEADKGDSPSSSPSPSPSVELETAQPEIQNSSSDSSPESQLKLTTVEAGEDVPDAKEKEEEDVNVSASLGNATAADNLPTQAAEDKPTTSEHAIVSPIDVSVLASPIGLNKMEGKSAMSIATEDETYYTPFPLSTSIAERNSDLGTIEDVVLAMAVDASERNQSSRSPPLGTDQSARPNPTPRRWSTQPIILRGQRKSTGSPLAESPESSQQDSK